MKYNLLKYAENEEKVQHLNIFIYIKLKTSITQNYGYILQKIKLSSNDEDFQKTLLVIFRFRYFDMSFLEFFVFDKIGCQISFIV